MFKKKVISVLLSIMMVFGSGLLVHGSEIVGSGSCGNNVNWTLDSDGGLVINGPRDIEDEFFNYNNWGANNYAIRNIIIENDVTGIGTGSFFDCSVVEDVSIGISIQTIGASAFFGCTALKRINIPSSVKSIGNNAFCHCESLETLELPNSVQQIGHDAFANCKSLRNIQLPENITDIQD